MESASFENMSVMGIKTVKMDLMNSLRYVVSVFKKKTVKLVIVRSL